MAASTSTDSAVTSPRPIILAVAGFSSYARDVVRGVHEYAALQGPFEFFLYPEINRERALEELQQFAARLKARGLICEMQSEQLLTLQRLGVPVIEVTGTWRPEQVPAVHADDAGIGRKAAEYLLSKGLQSFAFTGTPTALHSRQRQAAFVQTIQEAGYPCSVFDRAPKDLLQLAPDLSRFRAWLRSLPLPVGIMCWNDHVARDIRHACQREGLVVPTDVALLGTGNDELFCETFSPPLSSVDLSGRKVGYRAMQLLDQVLRGQTSFQGHDLIPPAGVIERASTQTTMQTDPNVAAVIHHIESNLERPVTMEEILSQVSISRRSLENHFYRLFKRGPWEHMRHLQMERAKSLLQNTNLPIQEISRRSGFADFATFSRTFKKLVNMTPKQYRQGRGCAVQPPPSC